MEYAMWNLSQSAAEAVYLPIIEKTEEEIMKLKAFENEKRRCMNCKRDDSMHDVHHGMKILDRQFTAGGDRVVRHIIKRRFRCIYCSYYETYITDKLF